MKHILIVSLALLPTIAQAHADTAHAASFMSGLWHPLAGADHLLAVWAVGLWAAVAGGRMIWALPVSFLLAMLAGAFAGTQGMGLVGVDLMIIASVILLGTAAALALRPGPVVALMAMIAFGTGHGLAHGSEGAGLAQGGYVAGIGAMTAALQLAGLAMGLATMRHAPMIARLLGAGVGTAGLVLAFA